MRLALLALAAALLAGCAQGYGPAGYGTATGPYDHSSVVNRSDQFVVSGDVRGFSGDQTYTWHTTKAQSTATWSGHITDGSIEITVKDALGQLVYTHTYGANSDSSGSEQVQGKLMGDWTVQVAFHGCTGSISLVIQ